MAQQLHSRGFALPLVYDKNRVLETLKSNREKHIETYKAAVEQYKLEVKQLNKTRRRNYAKAVRKLDEKIDAAQVGDELPGAYLDNEHIESPLQVPVSFVDVYDRAIEQLSTSTVTEVMLDDVAFTCFMLDQWAWKAQFTSVTEAYGYRNAMSKRAAT